MLWVNLVLLIITVILGSFLIQERFQTKPIIPIYIISLPNRKEKLADLLLKIKPSSSYRVEYVHVVDGNQFIEEFDSVKKGQIDRWLSHMVVWGMIARSDAPYAMILEDSTDIQLPAQFDRIESYIDQLPLEWKFLYLGGYINNKQFAVKYKSDIYRPNGTIWHNHAYLISRQASNELVNRMSYLETIKKRDQWQVLPLDEWLTDKTNGLLDSIYIVQPNIANFTSI